MYNFLYMQESCLGVSPDVKKFHMQESRLGVSPDLEKNARVI